MIKQIKHIISLIATISLLAITFIGCAQPTVPEAEAEKFTVKFSSAHGTAPKDLLVEKDYELKESDLKLLSDDNYKFLGWSFEGAEIKAGYKVTKNVTLEAKWEIKPITISSIELDKTRAIYSDKVEKVTVTIKGTGFKQLKDDPTKKLQFNVYSLKNLYGEVEREVISKLVDVIINYDTNIATAEYTLPKLGEDGTDGSIIRAITGDAVIPGGSSGNFEPIPIPGGNEWPAPTEPYNFDKIEYEFVPVLNGKEIDKKVNLIITDKPILLTDYYFFLNNQGVNNNTLSIADATKKFELIIGANALDYLNKIEIKMFDDTDNQFGNGILVDTKNIDPKKLTVALPVPNIMGNFTVKVYFNDKLQEQYYSDYNYDYVPFNNRVIHVIDNPKISSLSISDIGTAGSNTFDIIINGSNFTNTDGINIIYPDNLELKTDATFEYISDEQIKATIKKPITVGTYNIKVILNNNECSGKVTVRDTSTFIIGDILLKDGTIIKTEALTDSNKSDAVGVVAGFNSNGIPFAISVQNKAETMWAPRDTTGWNSCFDALVCKCSDGSWQKKDITTVSGDFDGSDNWSEILKVDNNAENNNRGNYPAFSFAQTLGDGWYLPTVVELFTVTPNQEIIEQSLKKIDSAYTLVGRYWTSSQETFRSGPLAWFVEFCTNTNDSYFDTNEKQTPYIVRCIKLL